VPLPPLATLARQHGRCTVHHTRYLACRLLYRSSLRLPPPDGSRSDCLAPPVVGRRFFPQRMNSRHRRAACSLRPSWSNRGQLAHRTGGPKKVCASLVACPVPAGSSVRRPPSPSRMEDNSWPSPRERLGQCHIVGRDSEIHFSPKPPFPQLPCPNAPVVTP